MLNKMIFCLTIIDLSFDMFDYKKKYKKDKKKKRKKKDKKIRIEPERAERTHKMNMFF